MSAHRHFILTATLLAGSLLPACVRQVSPDPKGIDTLVFAYETPAQRQDLQALFAEAGISLRLLTSAGGKAEYQLAVTDEQLATLTPKLGERYRIERREQRLYLVCCLP
ncbi:MAG: hypothetical protein ACAI44_28835 [Candidatus Sericytochromatia bacterium]